MTSSDHELLQRSATGDGAAFEEFLERHQAPVYRFVRSLTAGPAAAEDALQETFVAAWRGAAGCRGAGEARAWLFSIARNAARRQHRRRAGEPEEFVSLDDLGRQAGWGEQRDRDEALERLADRALLERGFARLSAEDREVLVLRELEGFSGEEVAGMIGLSVPAQKSRLHRARLRLVAALKALEEETNAGA